jgi:CheY-like chemotaxis protein
MTIAWIVDDDEEMIGAIQLMLKLLKYDSRYFLSARTAVEALMVEKLPDAMILDINMPEVSGMDLLEFLRQHPEWGQLPVVMLSTEAADVQVDQALAMGADAYVTKPVSLDELEEALQKAFKARRKN